MLNESSVELTSRCAAFDRSIRTAAVDPVDVAELELAGIAAATIRQLVSGPGTIIVVDDSMSSGARSGSFEDAAELAIAGPRPGGGLAGSARQAGAGVGNIELDLGNQ